LLAPLVRPPLTSTLLPYTTLFRSICTRAEHDQKSYDKRKPPRLQGPAGKWSCCLHWTRGYTHLQQGRIHARLESLPVTELHTCRSEEHTSELQSRENLVCRLLLEK